jgi:hypothetical protein
MSDIYIYMIIAAFFGVAFAIVLGIIKLLEFVTTRFDPEYGTYSVNITPNLLAGILGIAGLYLAYHYGLFDYLILLLNRPPGTISTGRHGGLAGVLTLLLAVPIILFLFALINLVRIFVFGRKP